MVQSRCADVSADGFDECKVHRCTFLGSSDRVEEHKRRSVVVIRGVDHVYNKVADEVEKR